MAPSLERAPSTVLFVVPGAVRARGFGLLVEDVRFRGEAGRDLGVAGGADLETRSRGRCPYRLLARVERGECATELLGFVAQLLKPLLDVVSNAIDQGVRLSPCFEVGRRPYIGLLGELERNDVG
jgi:hypothetical protein